MTTENIKQERKILDAVFWGGAFLWAGLIFGADYFDYLPQVGSANVWSWIFLGAGLYGLLINLFRLFNHQFVNPTPWDWVWSVIFIILGAAGFLSVDVPWWLILILIGVGILLGALFGRNIQEPADENRSVLEE